MKTISEQIDQILLDPKYPFHMPGHKRNAAASGQGDYCRYDFTEIEETDNLYAPQGAILESERRAAVLFGADRTFYLVNGSTAGLVAAILAAAGRGGKVLVGPDCHKAVYSALALGGVTGVDSDGRCFTCGENDTRPKALTNLAAMREAFDYEKLPERIESVLQAGSDIRAVVIVSPNYEGIVSDVARIADIAHAYDAALIVDEAHGAHFGMHKAFPDNSNRLGADIVVHSTHKMLGALTQTALLHVNGDRVEGADGGSSPVRFRIDPARVLSNLQMVQTSSPSYLLMRSIDKCVALLSERGEELFEAYTARLAEFRGRIGKLRHIALFDGENAVGDSCGDRVVKQEDGLIAETANLVTDPGKLVIAARANPAQAGEMAEEKAFDARDIYRILRAQYGLQLEFAQEDHALAMTSIFDTDEGFERLATALEEIDARIEDREPLADAADRPLAKTDCYEP